VIDPHATLPTKHACKAPPKVKNNIGGRVGLERWVIGNVTPTKVKR